MCKALLMGCRSSQKLSRSARRFAGGVVIAEILMVKLKVGILPM